MGSEFSNAQERPVTPATVDYFAILWRAIEAAKDDPNKLRSAVYNMARANLRREILWQNPAIPDAELNMHLLALEDAIERVEAGQSASYDNHIFRADDSQPLPDAVGQTQPVAEPHIVQPPPSIDVLRIVEALEVEPPAAEPPAQAIAWQPEPPTQAVDLDAQFESANAPEPPAESRGEIIILQPEPPMAMQSGPMLRAAPDIIVDYHPPSHEIRYMPEPPGRIRNGIGSFVQLTAAALLAVAIFAVMTGQLDIHWLSKKPGQAAVVHSVPEVAKETPKEAPKLAASAAAPKEVAPFPMPATYGVYAVNNDKLVELDRFSIRVPDPRVLISPEIREPSRVSLPDGKVSFIVFRRELANGAPEKVAVRVVAKIAREMTFTDGKATTSNVENIWRIRNNAFDFRVSPLGDNRDLIAIRPDADFVFPAGRYALVINGQGYDFSVAGPITSPLQCLERIETVNGAMYSECRNPQVN